MSKVITKKTKKIDYIKKVEFKILRSGSTSASGKFMSLEGNSKSGVATTLKKALKQHRGLKISLDARVRFINKIKNDELIVDFNIKPPKIATNNADVIPAMNALNTELIRRVDVAEVKKSGWVFDKFIKVEYPYNKYEPFKGGSFIPLPAYIANKKACINVKNEKDDECFKWAILSAPGVLVLW